MNDSTTLLIPQRSHHRSYALPSVAPTIITHAIAYRDSRRRNITSAMTHQRLKRFQRQAWIQAKEVSVL